MTYDVIGHLFYAKLYHVFQYNLSKVPKISYLLYFDGNVAMLNFKQNIAFMILIGLLILRKKRDKS